MGSELCGKAVTVLGPVDGDSLGITDEQIRTILVENPGRILSFVEANE